MDMKRAHMLVLLNSQTPGQSKRELCAFFLSRSIILICIPTLFYGSFSIENNICLQKKI